MVLKVVRGKILETLDLRGLLAPKNFGCRAKYRKQTIQILLPPVVGGKILETWELWRLRAARSYVLKLQMYVRLSKISYYLIDNMFVHMLSQLEWRGQGESWRAAEPVPNGESRASAGRLPERGNRARVIGA
jgi:hypothetical protein